MSRSAAPASSLLPRSPGRFPALSEVAAFVAGFALLALLPLVVGDSYGRHVLIMAFIYAVVASNWDLSLALLWQNTLRGIPPASDR